MAADYQLTHNPHTVCRTADGAFIPDDPANRDCQEYRAWLGGGNTPDPVAVVEPTANEILNSKLLDGIVLTCTGTPAVSGTYAMDEVSARQIYDIGLYASQFSTFPGGSIQPYPDVDGMPHNFTTTQFVAFLQVVAPLISDMNIQAQILAQGGTPVWPTQVGTIP